MKITRMVKIKMMFKPMIGNALHYCNCHGTGCNKDWTSAEGGDEQTTPAGDTIKWVFLFVFLGVCVCMCLIDLLGYEKKEATINSCSTWQFFFYLVISLRLFPDQ